MSAGERASRGLVRLGSWALPHNNRRTTCPPGRLRAGGGRLVIVASIRRSGTHLLIDTILNNFPAYRRCPLTVELDRFIDDEAQLDRLAASGGYVVKTHYPEAELPRSPARDARVRRLAEQAVVLIPWRPRHEAIAARRAIATGPEPAGRAGLLHRHGDEFDRFWLPLDPLDVPFADLTDRARVPGVVARLADLTGRVPRATVAYPPRRDQRARVYLDKALTRLLGRHSPVVNTTVGFALPRDQPADQPSFLPASNTASL